MKVVRIVVNVLALVLFPIWGPPAIWFYTVRELFSGDGDARATFLSGDRFLWE